MNIFAILLTSIIKYKKIISIASNFQCNGEIQMTELNICKIIPMENWNASV